MQLKGLLHLKTQQGWHVDYFRAHLLFYSEGHHLQGPRATTGRGLQSKSLSLCRCVQKITVNPRIVQVKILVFGESASSEVFVERNSECSLHFMTGIWSEWGWFSIMCAEWSDLAVEVRSGRTKESTSWRVYDGKLIMQIATEQGEICDVSSVRVEKNTSPTRTLKRFWTLSRVNSTAVNIWQL